MINDPQTLVSFIVIFLFCEQSFDVQPNYYIRKEVLALMIQFLHFYSTRGWEPGIIKRVFSERARSGLRS